MKKIILLFGLMAMSCGMTMQAITEAEIKAQEDSLSMAMGRIYGASLAKMYSANPQANKAEFEKAFDLMMGADTANTSYMDGLSLGISFYEQMRKMKFQQGITLNRQAFANALKSAMSAPAPADSDMMQLNTDIQNRIRDIEEGMAQKMIVPNKLAGEEFIAKKMKEDAGYKKTASGLVYKMLNEGKGSTFSADDNILLTYRGSNVAGSVFDESQDTVSFSPSSVVAGFREALLMMKPGSKLIAIMPASLAYGDKGAGKNPRTGKYAVQPGETLIFEISTFGVKKIATPASPAAAKKRVRAKDRNYKGNGKLPPKGMKK